MQEQFFIDAVKLLQEKNYIQQNNLTLIWKDIQEQKEFLKQIQNQKQQEQNIKGKKFIKVIAFIIPFLTVKEIFNLRLLSRKTLLCLKDNRNIIIQAIEKQIQQNQKILYQFDIKIYTSRELYAQIIKLNLQAQKIKEQKFQKDLEKLIDKICDPTQIYALEVANQIKYASPALKLMNKVQKELIGNYERTVDFINWDVPKEYAEYRQEMLRQRRIKRLRQLKEFTLNL